MKTAEERSKRVHGLAYAAFLSAAELFGTSSRAMVNEFRAFVVGHTVRSVADVREDVNVNVFWQMVIDAFKVGEFGRGEVLRQIFKVVSNPVLHPPDAPTQAPNTAMPFLEPWVSYRLMFDYNAVLLKLNSFLVTRQRSVLPLQRKDLRDQLSTYPYWVTGIPVVRFGAARSPTRCWAIDVDQHPLGYQPVSDDELMRSWEDCGHNVQKWNDPRKGELFLLVHELEGT